MQNSLQDSPTTTTTIEDSQQNQKNETILNSSDEKKDSDQETLETNIQQDESNHHHNQNQSHIDYRFNHPHPYNLYLTPITEEIDHERTIVGLKEQNNKLGEQLRFLNKKLTEILNKQQKKVQSKQALEQNSKDTLLVQKELDNTYKKVEYLQKENKFLKLRIEKLSPNMIQSLEALLKEKEQLIQKQQDEIKAYENMKRIMQKNNNIELKQNEAITKIDEQDKYIIQINSELKKIKLMNENNQKQMIKKQEQQIDLEQKYREICDYIGISTSIKSNLKDELKKIQVIKKSDQLIVIKHQINEMSSNQINNIEKQQNSSESLKAQLTAQEIKNKEINSLIKLKDIEITQLKQVVQELKNISSTPQRSIITKHRSNNSLIHKPTQAMSPLKLNPKILSIQERKLEQIGSILTSNKSALNIGSNNIQPLNIGQNNSALILESQVNRRKQSAQQSSQQQQQQQQIKQQLNPLKELSQKIRKEIIGKQEGCSRLVNDRAILKDMLHTKIVKIIVWSNHRTINGIQFFYKENNSKNNIIEGQKMVVDKHNEYTQTICDFTLNQTNDYLKTFECAISPQGFIDKVKFTTAKNQCFEIGSSVQSQKQIIKYNIDECEYPICAYSGLITFVGEKGQEMGSIVSFLGFEIMIDQDIINKKRQIKSYNPKGFSTFYFDKELFNQQNIKDKQQIIDIFDSNNNSQ